MYLFVVFFYLLSTISDQTSLLQHLINRFDLASGWEGALHDSLIVLTKTGNIQDVDKQLRSNLDQFNSRFRNISSFAITTDRILFVSNQTLYFAHPRLTPHSILPTSLSMPIISVVMGSRLALAIDTQGQVYAAGNSDSPHDIFAFE